VEHAFVLSIGSEVENYEIPIRDHFNIPHVFDHIVKFHYAGTKKRVLVLGSQKDDYYGIHIRNILREECGIMAPLVELRLASRVNLDDFDEILICYNKYLVRPLLAHWTDQLNTPIVYLDDLISRYHWIFHLCESLSSVFNLRDIIRGLMGHAVEETRALQFDAWTALRRDLAERASGTRNLLIYGSGCGVLPFLLRNCGANVRVYESDPVYKSNLRVAQHLGKFSFYEDSQFESDLDRLTDEDCVVFCDAINRCADPSEIVPLMKKAGAYYLTSFLSTATKPMQPALFRDIGDANVAFGRENRRDRRCYGLAHYIWLPRENSLREALGSEFRKIYETNEYFLRPEEYASGYVALAVGR